MPRVVNKRLRRKYKDKTCFDMVMFSDQKIIEFLEEDAFNFVIEIDKKIFCGNKKEILTRRTVKNGNLAYLCLKAGDTYDIRRDDIVDTIPYLRLESVGLSQGQVLISYYNIIEVIINSDDQIFVCKHMYDHLGNLLSSKSTVSLSVYINKGSVVSAAHCQPGGDYPIYSVYSVTHPDEREKLNHDFIIPRSIKKKDINEIRRDIDVRLGLNKDESVYVYFPEEWSMVVRKNKPDYGLSEEEDNWWNIKDGGRYRLQNDLIEIDDVTGEESNMEYLMMDFLEDKYDRGETTLAALRETLENQIQRPDELPESIDDFIKRLGGDEEEAEDGQQWIASLISSDSADRDEESDEETEPGYEGFKIIHEVLHLVPTAPLAGLRPQTLLDIDVYTHNGTEALPRYPTMIFMIDKDVDLSLATIHERVEHPWGLEPIDVYLKRLDDGALMNVGKLEFIHPAGQPIRGEIRLNPPSEDFPEPIEERPEFQAPPPSPVLNPRRLDFGDSGEDSGSSGEDGYHSDSSDEFELKELPEIVKAHDGEEIKIDVYTNNGTDPLPRYPSMIFMINADEDLTKIIRWGLVIAVFLKRHDGSNVNVGTLMFKDDPKRGEIRLYEPEEGIENIEDYPEFQPSVESPQSIPSTYDSDDLLGEDSEEVSLQPYIQEAKYSDKDYVRENYAKYTNIFYNKYMQTTNLSSKDDILKHYAVFKFIMSKLEILIEMLNAGLSHPTFSYEELEDHTLEFETKLINKYGSRSDANFQVREDMQKSFDNFMRQIGWDIVNKKFNSLE